MWYRPGEAVRAEQQAWYIIVASFNLAPCHHQQLCRFIIANVIYLNYHISQNYKVSLRTDPTRPKCPDFVWPLLFLCDSLMKWSRPSGVWCREYWRVSCDALTGPGMMQYQDTQTSREQTLATSNDVMKQSRCWCWWVRPGHWS